MVKIKKYKLYHVIILLICIMLLRVDLFFKNTNDINLNLQHVLAAGIIAVLAVYAMRYKKLFKSEYTMVIKYFIFYVPIVVLWMLYSKYMYHYSLKTTLIATLPYLYVLAAIPLVYVFSNLGPNMFLKELAMIQFALIVVKFIGWYTYNFTDNTIFEHFVTEYSGWIRDGLQRVDGGAFVAPAFVYYLSNIFGKKKVKIADFAILGIMFAYAVLVMQARGLYLSMLVTAAATLYFTRRNSQTRTILIVTACIAAASLIFNKDVFEFFGTFKTAGKYGYSTVWRYETLLHFFKLYKRNKFIGLGFLDNFANTASLFYDKKTKLYYMSDMGIFTTLMRFGPLSVFVIFYLYYLMISALKDTREKDGKYVPWVVSSVCFFVVYSLFVGIYESTSGLSTGIFLAALSYICGKRENDAEVPQENKKKNKRRFLLPKEWIKEKKNGESQI